MATSTFFYPTRTSATRRTRRRGAARQNLRYHSDREEIRDMRVLLVHPSPLMYSELYLRLEPLGLERVAAAIRAAGHQGRAVGPPTFSGGGYLRGATRCGCSTCRFFRPPTTGGSSTRSRRRPSASRCTILAQCPRASTSTSRARRSKPRG